MATFVKMTGLSPELLRAWERRHHLLEPQRSAGGHREYTEADLRVIERVRELLSEGRSIGEVARMGRKRLLAESKPTVLSDRGSGSPEVQCARLVETAAALDELGIQRVLDDAFALLSPLETVEQVIVPAARKVGELWAAGSLSIASERLLSVQVQYRLQKLIELVGSAPRTGAPVLCACFPGELHELGLLIITLKLAGSGRRICYFGQALPLEALEEAILRLEPSAVCLSVSRTEIFEPWQRELATLARRHKRLPFWIGGAGAPARSDVLSRAGVRIWSGARPLADFLEAIDARS